MRVTGLRKVALPLLIAALAWVLLAGIARAQDPAETVLDLRLPEEGAVGQDMTLEAHLTDGTGADVAGAEVVFHREADFMNTLTELELGRVVTDERGMAMVSFVPRSEGEMLITASFDGNGQFGPAFASSTVPIATGPALYSEEAGVDVPGLNVSLLAGILGGVWGTYFVIMVLIFLIAREGAEPPEYIGGIRE